MYLKTAFFTYLFIYSLPVYSCWHSGPKSKTVMNCDKGTITHLGISEDGQYIYVGVQNTKSKVSCGIRYERVKDKNGELFVPVLEVSSLDRSLFNGKRARFSRALIACSANKKIKAVAKDTFIDVYILQ